MLAAGLIALGAGFVWTAFWAFARALAGGTPNTAPLTIGFTVMGTGAVLSVAGGVAWLIG